MWFKLQTGRQRNRQPIDWFIYQVTLPPLITRPQTKDTDEEGFPLVLTEFVQTNGLQEERLGLVLFVRRAAFQFVVVNPTILPDTLAFYTETKTRQNI